MSKTSKIFKTLQHALQSNVKMAAKNLGTRILPRTIEKTEEVVGLKGSTNYRST